MKAKRVKKTGGRKRDTMSRVRTCNRLAEIRTKKLNLTQDAFASKIGLTADAINKIERLDVTPSLETIEKICVTFKISYTAFFAPIEDPKDNSGNAGRTKLYNLLKTKPASDVTRVHALAQLFFIK